MQSNECEAMTLNDQETIDLCDVAIMTTLAGIRARARSSCAEILNARAAKESK